MPDTRGRHKLRIAIKKVRYACEFFESVYEGRKVERRRKVFTTTLKGIQSGLSRLNDMQVHCKLAHRFAHSRSGVPNQTEKAFAIGLLTKESTPRRRRSWPMQSRLRARYRISSHSDTETIGTKEKAFLLSLIQAA